jgi:hypothetical protein
MCARLLCNGANLRVMKYRRRTRLTLEEYIAVAVQTKDLSPDAVSNLGNSNF